MCGPFMLADASSEGSLKHGVELSRVLHVGPEVLEQDHTVRANQFLQVLAECVHVLAVAPGVFLHG